MHTVMHSTLQSTLSVIVSMLLVACAVQSSLVVCF
jgi:hypothetical protein